MNLDDCFAILDNPQGSYDEGLMGLSEHCTPNALQGIISRLALPHLQPLKTVLQQSILHMVQGDAWLQECLLDAFIASNYGLQKILIPVMAQLGSKALMLDKLSKACMNERDAKRGYRFLKLMKGFPNEWNGPEGVKIRDELKKSQFVHRVLFWIQDLKDPDGWLRRSAPDVLGEINDVRAVKPLIQALQYNATEAYSEELDRSDFYDFIQDLRRMVKALVQIGEPAVDTLILALTDKNMWVRSEAAWALGKIGDVRAVEPLIWALKDGFWSIRENAADALGEIKDSCAVESLILALKDETDQNVRVALEQAIKSIQPLPLLDMLE